MCFKYIRLILTCVSLTVCSSAFAQNYPTSEDYLFVATINQDKLFSDSLYGQAFNKKFKQDAEILSTENRRIEKELVEEEQDLTQKRKELSNEEFRKLADVFNTKVEEIRREQSRKSNELNASRIQAQRAFFAQAQPIISNLMQERGIQFILNDQAIFMAGKSGDITNIAIERIDQVLGGTASENLE